MPESAGGDTLYARASAKAGTGLDELLEKIALQAEILNLKANPNRPAARAGNRTARCLRAALSLCAA